MKMNIIRRLFLFLCFSGFCFLLSAQNASGEVKKVRIGFFEDNIFHQGQTDEERKSGYGYEYYQELAKYTDWKYVYVYGTWNDIYRKFLKGEIDIIDAVPRTKEREQKMLFSEAPMGTDDFYVFTLEDNKEISEFDISTLNGKKIGVNRNSVSQVYLEDFIQTKGLDCQVVPCDNYGHRITLLLSGEIDAMVTTDALSAQGIRAAVKIASQDFYFAVQNSRPDLLAELNLAQTKLLRRTPGFETELRKKYYFNSVVRSHLNKDELQWMENNPVLKIGYRVNVMPFCTQSEKTGRLTGMLADVLADMEENLGVRFEPIPFGNNNTMIEALRNGVIDISFPVVSDIWYSETQGYIQTTPVVQNRMALVYAGNYRGESEYVKIGYVSGSPAQELILSSMGLMDRSVPFESMDTLFKAILKGKVDCTIMNADVANYQIHQNETYSILKTANLDQYVAFSFGLNRKDTQLYSIIELGLMLQNAGAINESINRYSYIEDDYSFFYFWKKNRFLITTAAILILTVFLVVVLFYNANLRKEKERFREAHEKAMQADADARTDELTKVANRRAFYEVLEDKNNAKKYMVVGFLDVDDFKAFNNKYGHDTGDQVLRFIVKCLKTAFNDDFIARFGGDEFVIISEKPLQEVKVLSEYFLQLLKEGMVLRSKGERVSVGSSVGLTEVKRPAEDIRDILNQADIAMYRAKNRGKNRVFCN